MRNIFSAAEIEAGEITPQSAMVEINELVASEVRYFKFPIHHHNLNLKIKPSDTKYFKTDGKLLQVIVMNLLANAVEFSPEGSTISMTCEVTEDRHLNFIIRDEGPGIPNEKRKQIFERFKQLDSGTTKSHHGHGLGLSIVKEFVDALRGKIEIDSVVDQYTAVSISIPEFEMSQLPEGFSMDSQEILFGDTEIL